MPINLNPDPSSTYGASQEYRDAWFAQYGQVTPVSNNQLVKSSITATSSQWASSTLILDDGQLGFDSTLNIYKVGNGVNLWPALAQLASGGSGDGASDAFVAQLISTPTSATRLALDALYGVVSVPTPDPSLDVWFDAVSKVKNGTGDAVLLAIGDSTTAGAGGENDFGYTTLDVGGPHSYPAQLVNRLRAAGIPAAPGFSIPSNGVGNDHRWIQNGWTVTGFGLGRCGNYANDPAQVLVFNPAAYGADATLIYDTFDVYFLRYPGCGTVSVRATGGAETIVDTDATDSVIGAIKVTVPAGSSSATNTVSIHPVAGPIFMTGIEPRHSTTRRVRVGNAGVSGAGTGPFVDAIDNLGSGPVLDALSPDLTVISLGINDANANLSSAVYATNIAGLGDKCKVSGDVLYCPPIPGAFGSPTYLLANEAAYATKIELLADGNYLDLTPILGGDPDLYADGTHPTAEGYGLIADAVAVKIIPLTPS